jgi:hypothetical protein
MPLFSAPEPWELPLRAQVAVAARCARRVQPLFMRWSTGTREQETVELAIHIAEKFANGEVDSRFDIAPFRRDLAAGGGNGRGHVAAFFAARAAGAAAVAAYYAVVSSCTDKISDANCAAQAADTANHSGIWAFTYVDDESKAAAIAALFADDNKVFDLKLGTFPGLGQPIDPSENGPLGSLWRPGLDSEEIRDRRFP